MCRERQRHAGQCHLRVPLQWTLLTFAHKIHMMATLVVSAINSTVGVCCMVVCLTSLGFLIQSENKVSERARLSVVSNCVDASQCR